MAVDEIKKLEDKNVNTFLKMDSKDPYTYKCYELIVKLIEFKQNNYIDLNEFLNDFGFDKKFYKLMLSFPQDITYATALKIYTHID